MKNDHFITFHIRAIMINRRTFSYCSRNPRVSTRKGRQYIDEGYMASSFEARNAPDIAHQYVILFLFICGETMCEVSIVTCSSTASTKYQPQLHMKVSRHVTWSRNFLSKVEIFRFFRPHRPNPRVPVPVVKSRS